MSYNRCVLFLASALPSCRRSRSPVWTGDESCPGAPDAGESSPFGDPLPAARAGRTRPPNLPFSHHGVPGTHTHTHILINLMGKEKTGENLPVEREQFEAQYYSIKLSQTLLSEILFSQTIKGY